MQYTALPPESGSMLLLGPRLPVMIDYDECLSKEPNKRWSYPSVHHRARRERQHFLMKLICSEQPEGQAATVIMPSSHSTLATIKVEGRGQVYRSTLVVVELRRARVVPQVDSACGEV